MMSEDETGPRKAGLDRRDALKDTAGAAATVAAAVAATPALGAAEAALDPEKNPYGGGPGTGISLPPYFRPTDGLKNNNVYYPGTEELGEDEMRISFVGSAPWPPRRDQAGLPASWSSSATESASSSTSAPAACATSSPCNCRSGW